jgi:hypothetical protein
VQLLSKRPPEGCDPHRAALLWHTTSDLSEV